MPYADGFGRWERALGEGRVLHGLTRDHPESERTYLERESVLSSMSLPVFVGGEWWGFIGFDQCEEERIWQPAEIDALRVVANTLGAAIGRERAEHRLTEAEARYRTLVEAIPAVTYVQPVDRASGPRYISPQLRTLLGYDPATFSFEQWKESVHADDRERVFAEEARTDRTGDPFHMEYRMMRADGEVVWVQDEALLIRDDEGKPFFWQGVRFDVTARKVAEEQLREAEQRYRAIVEHVPAIIYVDLPEESQKSVYVSPQVEQLTGITQEEWTSEPDHRIGAVHPEDREATRASFLTALRASEPWSAEYRMITRDGRTIWIRDECSLMRDDDGVPQFVQGVMFDITERKLAEEQLRESEQRERDAAERLRALDEMKNTFLAAVSHELRSPLTSILGLSLTLERQHDLDDGDREDLLERLSTNALKLDRLLKDLLDIDRLNRGIVAPQYRLIDVGALAQRTVGSLDSLADRTIVVHVEPVVITVDPAKVERIVENLLVNAARHTPADREIWLRVAASDGGALITVEDDGGGVPAELREVIFEPFRQGPTASAHSPGTGIGLSLVASFAALHGGRAWVEDREGGGASFRVFLPKGPAEANGNTRTAEHRDLAGAG